MYGFRGVGHEATADWVVKEAAVKVEHVNIVFQGFVSFLLPCFAVDHLYLSYDEYLLSEDETPISEGKLTCCLKTAHCLLLVVS